MPHKTSVALITAAALAFCGQAFAQHSTAQPIDKPPNINPDPLTQPDTPAERVQPKADASDKVDSHKSQRSGTKKKPRPSRKSTDSDRNNIAPAIGDDAIPLSR